MPDFITLWYCKRKILRVKIGTFGQEEAYSTRTIHIDLAKTKLESEKYNYSFSNLIFHLEMIHFTGDIYEKLVTLA